MKLTDRLQLAADALKEQRWADAFAMFAEIGPDFEHRGKPGKPFWSAAWTGEAADTIMAAGGAPSVLQWLGWKGRARIVVQQQNTGAFHVTAHGKP